MHPLLDGDEPELVVQQANPRVLLQLALAVGPAEDLRGPLDYGKNDHRLIGILATLMRHLEGTPDPSTMFFTNDRIAGATARQLGLPVRRMGDHWKRPRQDDEEEDGTQEVRGLRAELAAYRAREPSIVIEHEGNDVVETVHQVARALTDAEVEGLVEELKAKHPLCEDFTPPPPSVRSDDLDALLGYSLKPPDEADVRRYQDEDYPRWLDACRGVLLRLHEGRDGPEEPVRLRWRLRNEGSRPATRVRVEFRTEGPLALLRSDRDEIYETMGGRASPSPAPRSTLPRPPTPPAFKRVPGARPSVEEPGVRLDLAAMRTPDRTVRARADLASMHGALDAALGGLEAARLSGALDAVGAAGAAHRLPDYERLLGRIHGWDGGALGTSMRSIMVPPPEPTLPRLFAPLRHDPEAFYYDEWDMLTPVQRGALTCDLWRHKGRAELWRHKGRAEAFDMEVEFGADGPAGGRVRCVVHAENLTEPVNKAVVVRRTVEETLLVEEARQLVADCE